MVRKKITPDAEFPVVLGDHKRVGKRFVPPLLQLRGPMGDIYWMNDILPELLWIALLNDNYGWLRGNELTLELGENINKVSKKVSIVPCTTSYFARLTQSQKERFLNSLDEDALKEVRLSLEPLVFMYPNCPFRTLFFGDLVEPPDSVRSNYLKIITRVVEEISDRRSLQATKVQGNAVYLLLSIGRIKIVKDVWEKSPLKDFQNLESYPNTDKSREIASSIRALLNGIMGFQTEKKAASRWSQYFWNRGLEISQCELESAKNDE